MDLLSCGNLLGYVGADRSCSPPGASVPAVFDSATIYVSDFRPIAPANNRFDIQVDFEQATGTNGILFTLDLDSEDSCVGNLQLRSANGGLSLVWYRFGVTVELQVGGQPFNDGASASIALQFSGSDLAVVDLNGTGRSVLGQLTLNGFGAAGTPNAMFYVGGQPISLNLDVRLLFRGTISTLIYSGYP